MFLQKRLISFLNKKSYKHTNKQAYKKQIGGFKFNKGKQLGGKKAFGLKKRGFFSKKGVKSKIKGKGLKPFAGKKVFRKKKSYKHYIENLLDRRIVTNKSKAKYRNKLLVAENIFKDETKKKRGSKSGRYWKNKKDQFWTVSKKLKGDDYEDLSHLLVDKRAERISKRDKGLSFYKKTTKTQEQLRNTYANILKKKRKFKFLLRKQLYKNICTRRFNNIRKSKNGFIYFLGRRYVFDLKTRFIGLLRQIYGISLKRFSLFFSSYFGYSLSSLLLFMPVTMFEQFHKRLRTLMLNFELKKYVNNNIFVKRKYGLYGGYRTMLGLPSRGQRSKTNARTAKKFRRVVADVTVRKRKR